MRIGHLLWALLIATTVGTAAADGTDVRRAKFGAIAYELSCAVCHGQDGRGEAPLATELSVPAPDLTLLARRNGGVFPADAVSSIIRGGAGVTEHGGQMPAWGLLFLKDFAQVAPGTPRDDAALAARRIGDLVAYLQSIQQPGDNPMNLTRGELTAQPMIYVTTRSSMQDIQKVMATSFQTLGKFLGSAQVVPLGPPLAIYHDWTDDQTAIDVAFPVSEADAAKAKGEVLAGRTPSGFALKAIHRGSYDKFADTYAAIQAEMQRAGVAPSTRMWEVYLGEPGVTPETDLVTEIYMQVSAEDAARFPTP